MCQPNHSYVDFSFVYTVILHMAVWLYCDAQCLVKCTGVGAGNMPPPAQSTEALAKSISEECKIHMALK